MESHATDFEENSARFLTWFSSQPGTFMHPSLRLADLRNRHAGRGIVAVADIPANTDLFAIPRSIVIKVENSRLAQKLPKRFDGSDIIAEGENELDDTCISDDIPKPWIDLILVLIFEFLNRDTSQWAPYLDVLPRTPSDFDTLMFWTSTEVQELQASHVVSKIGRTTADKILRERVVPIVMQNAGVFYPQVAPSHLTDEEVLQMAHCVGSLIMSYAFDLQPELTSDDSSNEDSGAVDGWKEDTAPEGTMGMVPMADMLNADAEFNAHLSHGDDVLTMTSIRKINAGEEVLNYYGPLPNAELCRRYGYTSPKNATYDVMELSWPLVKQSIIDEFIDEAQTLKDWLLQRIKKLEEEADLMNETFVVERETDGPDDAGICINPGTFLNLPEDFLNLMVDILDESKGRVDEKRQKIRILSIFLRSLKTRLGQYHTTAAQDELLAPQSVGRTRMAIDIRHGEKRLIETAIAWAEGKLQALVERTVTRQQTASNQPRKRQKRGP